MSVSSEVRQSHVIEAPSGTIEYIYLTAWIVTLIWRGNELSDFCGWNRQGQSGTVAIAVHICSREQCKLRNSEPPERSQHQRPLIRNPER